MTAVAMTTVTGHLQAWLCPESPTYHCLLCMSLRQAGLGGSHELLGRKCGYMCPASPPLLCGLIYHRHFLSSATWFACRVASSPPKPVEALSSQELWNGEQGSTHPPPVPLPFLLRCVRGSLEASFSSSVHSRSHSSSVYTSPDWCEGKLVQEAAPLTCLHPLLPPRQPPSLA